MKTDPYIYQILTQNWTHTFTKNQPIDLPKLRFEKGSFIYQRGENGTLFRGTSPIPLSTWVPPGHASQPYSDSMKQRSTFSKVNRSRNNRIINHFEPISHITALLKMLKVQSTPLPHCFCYVDNFPGHYHRRSKVKSIHSCANNSTRTCVAAHVRLCMYIHKPISPHKPQSHTADTHTFSSHLYGCALQFSSYTFNIPVDLAVQTKTT